ncbi:hypothetical protein MJO28_003795 [Puccinia striiformis f. sp. tritici]|uniref:Uncharacterized protein n=1 Tax=Puccinia striiformis f. sp. tritici TaxID=168172 RepID=A0ACC0EML8_9BASI|nr:hypothetical protein MJO28_003795 [Puccinia striiformis f. sp. tritici]
MFYLILFVYILGGLTFIPVIIFITGVILYYSSPQIKQSSTGRIGSSEESASLLSNDSKEDQTKNGNEVELPRLYRAGWLTVRQSYQPSQNSESTYMGLITNSYRNFMDQRSKDSKKTKPKDRFYTVLKQNVLFLYQDEDQIDCTAAIQVSLYDVDLYPAGSPDGELFVKKKAICLKPMIQNQSCDPINSQPSGGNPSDQQTTHQPGRPAAWFIFTKNNLEKEDWYHILLASSKLTGPDSKATFQKDASLFDSHDMAKLVEGIDQQPDPIPMRWMNAMIGRLFLSTYRTHAFEYWIIDRIMKKLAKVQTPAFLSAINVREVHVGSTTPFFSKPMLKELTIDGDASMEVLVSYKGEFRITIETVATINLGARFKPYVVNLVLAVVLKELSGTLLLKIKRPPTNRLWFGFTAMPHLVLDLEPVVSTRQIKWALVLKPIESRIREVVLESIVYPNLDDLVFFDTQPYTHHGGIWGDAARKEKSTHDDAQDEQGSDGSASPTEDVKTSKPHGSSPTHKKSHSMPHPQLFPQTTKTSLSTAREDSNLSQDTIRQRTTNKTADESEESSEIVAPPPTADEPIENSPTLSLNQPENKRSSWFSTNRRQDIVSTQSGAQAPSSRSRNISNQNKNRHSQQQSTESEEGDAVAKLQKFLRSHPENSSNSHPSTPQLDSKSTPQLPRVSEPEEFEFSSSSGPTTPLTNFSEGPLQNHTQPSQSSSPQHRHPTEELESVAVGSPLAQTMSLQSSEENSASASPLLRRLPPPPRQTLPSTFLPPPTRNTPTATADSRSNNNQSTSSNSILNQLRTRATDKEALTASVTQARDTVIKWGAAWASKRKSPQANHHSYPYNSGFNPISIDHVNNSSSIGDNHKSSILENYSDKQRLSSLNEPVDMDISPMTDPVEDTLEEPLEDEDEDGGHGPHKSKSYRAHRARITGMGKTKSMDVTTASTPPSPSPTAQEITRSASPITLETPASSSSTTTTNTTSQFIRLKPSISKLLGSNTVNTSVNTDDLPASMGKRNRIFSSNGQFIPAAPLSTTGLSIPSAPSTHNDRSSNHSSSSSTSSSESKLLKPKAVVVDERSAPTLTPTTTEITSANSNQNPKPTTSTTTKIGGTHEIFSERSSYKPAPMMMIPGIKDSSHRFGIGSDSLSSTTTSYPSIIENDESINPTPMSIVLNSVASSSGGVSSSLEQNLDDLLDQKEDGPVLVTLSGSKLTKTAITTDADEEIEEEESNDEEQGDHQRLKETEVANDHKNDGHTSSLPSFINVSLIKPPPAAALPNRLPSDVHLKFDSSSSLLINEIPSSSTLLNSTDTIQNLNSNQSSVTLTQPDTVNHVHDDQSIPENANDTLLSGSDNNQIDSVSSHIDDAWGL